MTKPPVVVGLGEVLWDHLPQGKRWGGAPANFACQAGQLGAEAWIVSAIGNDFEGEALLKAVQERNIETCVPTDPHQATGIVNVTLDAKGSPSYDIVTNRAWDHIPFTPRMQALAERADAVAFGTLAQRSVRSRATIHEFLQHTRMDCLRIFDVNLRQTFFSHEIIVDSMQLADVLKVSEDELLILSEMLGFPKAPLEFAAAVMDRFVVRYVVLTRGERGCMIITKDDHADFEGVPTDVVDSVGAGDAFLASVTMGLLNGVDIHLLAVMACRIAASVCAQEGATPILPGDLTTDFINTLSPIEDAS